MSGLLIAGALIEVPGVVVIGPHEAKWSQLSPGDYRQRRGSPHQVMLHTTKGDWPQKIMAGAGPAGRAERTAAMWGDDPAYSGAHIVVGSDGVVACLADLELVEAYHATVSNPFSIGIEIYQEAGGMIYQAALDAAVKVCDVIAETCSIPRQYPRKPYLHRPLDRMLNGGRDVYGFVGHRDNTDRRGRGDPGDAIFDALAVAGYEGFDIAAGEDLTAWKRRQARLNQLGETLTVDGLPGPSTIAALRKHGYTSGRALDVAAVF